MADVTISGLSQGIPDKNTAIIPYSDGTTTYKTSPSGIVAASPGCILQVVQVYKTDVWSTTTINTFQDVPGLSLSMTLKKLDNKIMITGDVAGGRSLFSGGHDSWIRILKNNTTAVGGGLDLDIIGQWAGQNPYEVQIKSFNFIDSNISQLTNNYKIQYWLNVGGIGYINARGVDGGFRSASNFTLTEIAR